jgi:hypothetical protein
MLDQIMQTGAFAVGAVAVVDEQADDRNGGGNDLVRQEQNSAVAREDPVTGDAAEHHAEINSGRDRLVGPDGDGGEAYVVGVFQNPEPPAAVKGDIELARQAVQPAVVQDVMVEFAGERPRVDQLLRIDAGGRAARQIANVVGPGAARGSPSSSIAISTAIECAAPISRICKLARVVTWR